MSQNPSGRPHIDDELQREIDAALGDQNVDQLMEQSAADAAGPSEGAEGGAQGGDADPQEFHHEVRRGRISAIRGEDVFVDIAGEAGKLQGVVPLTQFDRPPRLGSIMDFVVDRIDEGQGLIYLSREGAVSRATWEQLQKGAVVEARVTSTNKGGLELEMVGGIRGFMPASQIDLHHIDDLEPLVGEKYEAVVQEIDRKSKKVVLSRRALLQQRRQQAKKQLLEKLEVGQVLDGTVSNLADFGAFVDIGGVDGLVHVSDMAYTHVNKPSEVVKVGEKVKVKVLKVDRDKAGKERISLGMKQVQPDPWENIGARLHVGDEVAARILRTANFGAFAEVEAGVEALMPMSELSWKRIGRAEDVVQVGQVVRARILSLDPDKQRMSLSLKQVAGDPWTGAERKFEQDTWHDGKVLSTTDFGAFVELEPGVEGMVHISELADRRVGSVEEIVKPGDVKSFRVLEADEENRRIRLSLKKEGAGSAQAAPQDRGPAPKAAPRKPRKDLKGGMSGGGAMGMGLGNLRLEDLK